MNNMLWLIRREIWENRSLWIAPLVVAGVILIISAFGGVHVGDGNNFSFGWDDSGSHVSAQDREHFRDALASAPLTWTIRRPGRSVATPVPSCTASPLPSVPRGPQSSTALTEKPPGPSAIPISANGARRSPRPGASSDSASSTLVLPAPFSPTSRLRRALPSRRLVAWLRKLERVIRSSAIGSPG